jgi:uncharacterized membrane protein YphA (DoxX/SURF4 family)
MIGLMPAPAITIARLLLSALFLFSGIIKMFDPRGFSITVAKFGMLPRQLVKPFAYALPVVEAIIGAALLLRYQLAWSGIAAAALIAISEIGIAGALIKQKKIENCGCFGAAIKVPVTWRKFFENLFWLALAVVVAVGTW